MFNKILEWFFISPTPTITIISAATAFFAYLYQRKWNRKQRANQISEWYCKIAIPKSRYIRSILSAVGNDEYVSKFTEIKHFTSSELQSKLDDGSFKQEQFIKNFNKINTDALDEAFCFGGCNENIYKSHMLLKKMIKNHDNIKYEIIDRFVIDFLNELETVALQINCNLAEGKLIYPILHQTFLKNIKSWYFFISKENQFDHNRYYPNIISLYLSWNQKSVKDENNFNKSVNKNNRIKKV